MRKHTATLTLIPWFLLRKEPFPPRHSPKRFGPTLFFVFLTRTTTSPFIQIINRMQLTARFHPPAPSSATGVQSFLCRKQSQLCRVRRVGQSERGGWYDVHPSSAPIRNSHAKAGGRSESGNDCFIWYKGIRSIWRATLMSGTYVTRKITLISFV